MAKPNTVYRRTKINKNKGMKKARPDYSIIEPPDELRGRKSYLKKIKAFQAGHNNNLPPPEDIEFSLCVNDFEHICEEKNLNKNVARYGFASPELQTIRANIIRELVFDLGYSWDHAAYAFDRPLSTLSYWEGKVPI